MFYADKSMQNAALLAASEADSKLLLSQAEQLVKSQRQNTSPVTAALETFAQKLQVCVCETGSMVEILVLTIWKP